MASRCLRRSRRRPCKCWDSLVVSLTFDDGLDQHLDVVVPLLNQRNLRGTFYVHLTAPTVSRRWRDWEAVAERGHELGNHTVFHPADERKAWVLSGNALDDYTADRMQRELECANALLHAIDGRSERTFAYPCSNRTLGRRGWAKRLAFAAGFERSRVPSLIDRWKLDIGSTEYDYSSLVLKTCFAGRAGGVSMESPVPPLPQFSRTALLSAAVESHSFDALRDFTLRALTSGSWAILQFHGVAGGHRMNCDRDVFDRYTDWLTTEHPHEVVTVIEGAKRIWSNSPHSTE